MIRNFVIYTHHIRYGAIHYTHVLIDVEVDFVSLFPTINLAIL
jgi:hypothetical protein